LDFQPGFDVDVFGHHEIPGIGHGQQQNLIFFRERNDQMFSGGGLGQQMDHLRINFHFGQVHGLGPPFAGKDLKHVHLIRPFFSTTIC
jgi:hypothetical protein